MKVLIALLTCTVLVIVGTRLILSTSVPLGPEVPTTFRYDSKQSPDEWRYETANFTAGLLLGSYPYAQRLEALRQCKQMLLTDKKSVTNRSVLAKFEAAIERFDDAIATVERFPAIDSFVDVQLLGRTLRRCRVTKINYSTGQITIVKAGRQEVIQLSHVIKTHPA